MASLMEELLDVLGKEEKQYQELITLASEKTDAVVQGNIEHLTDVTTREQDAASVLLNLSNKRNRYGDCLRSEPGRDDDHKDDRIS